MNRGKDTVLLVQPLDATIGDPGLILANLTEDNYAIENDILDEQTKMGRIIEYGNNKESFDLTCYGEKGDPGQLAVLNAIKKKVKLKVWEVDLVKNANDAYDSTFAYCVVESAEKKNADSFQEVSASLQVVGESVEGELTTVPAALLEIASMDFEMPGDTGVPVTP